MFLAGFSITAHCDSSWEAFLKSPDKDALLKLESSIARSAQSCRWGNLANPDVAPTKVQNTQLFKLIGQGNESAFRAALLVSRCLDGGELGDFNRSAGMFFEEQPLAFLQIIEERAIPDSQLKHLLTMLPLDTVDDIDRKIRVLEKRIDLLNKIDEDSLDATKRGFSFLKKEKDNLDRIKKQSPRSSD